MQGLFVQQWSKMGLGLDYTRERFTMDEGFQKRFTKYS